MYFGCRRSNRAGRKSERGVTLVMMALMVFLALGMSALAIDYGMIKATKAEAQRATDAAALAGASAFLISDPDADIPAIAEARARDFAKKHDVHGVTITDGEVTVDVDLPKTTVTVTYAGGAMPLYFANTFGINTMAVNALSAAHVEETNVASCVKPVAIPDMWNNKAHLDKKGKEIEDLVPDRAWGFKDLPGGVPGGWEEGESEPWTYDPALGDSYNPAVDGYGSTARTDLVKDYGRQIMLMSLSSKDGATPSYYYAWGHDPSDNSADKLAARIKGETCEEAATDTPYNYELTNGGKVGPITGAWDDLINQDPDAHWDGTTVVGSNQGTKWLDRSPRVVLVGMYNVGLYGGTPSDNVVKFNNIAKVFVEKRACSGNGACKSPVTGRFLGFASGGGLPGAPVGSLVKKLVLIK
jgi:Flp pilus assembly protein TadG